MMAFLAAMVSLGANRAYGEDETTESAVWLLKKATLVHRNGLHNVLLRSLRQMEDPQLEPLFSELVKRQHPVLKIHGILGLAEISKEKQIDLKLFADLKDLPTKATLIQSALEANLLNAEQSEKLLGWSGLEPTVKVLLAAKLVGEGKFKDMSVLEKAGESEKLQIQAMSDLMKLQMGDPKGREGLDKLNSDTSPIKDSIRAILLQTAMRHKYDKTGAWAMGLTQEKGVNEGIQFLSLRAAMQFKAPGAAGLWLQRYEASDGLATKTRMAILALDLSEHLEPATFDVLLQSDQAILKLIGQVGATIARKEDPAGAIEKLLAENNVLASKWVMQYTENLPPAKSRAILTAVIKATEAAPNPARFKAERLESAVMAAEMLCDKDDQATSILPPLLEGSPDLTQEAILMGLIRGHSNKGVAIIGGIKQWKTETAENLALVLRAKSGAKMTGKELDQLALIIRGGGGLQEPLRVQAAWTYLKLTQQHKVAMTSVLNGK